VAAGIFAQLNNVRLAAGKSSLGWLNPLIYSNPQCFNDVSDGSQNNCNIGTTGFATLSGWDPATGLGSPNFACLAKVVV
jgi:tripeptidyl-peptidase-1